MRRLEYEAVLNYTKVLDGLNDVKKAISEAGTKVVINLDASQYTKEVDNINKNKIKQEVDIEEVKNKFAEVRTIARDTGVELDKEHILKLSGEWAELDEDLKTMQKALKEVTDKEQRIEIKSNMKLLASETTEAQRKLQNYLNTGDESTSRLQVKFSKVAEEIRKSRDELANTGKQTAVLDLIIKKAEELEAKFKAGSISVEDFEKQLQSLQNQANSSVKGFTNLGDTIKGVALRLGGMKLLWDSFKEFAKNDQTETRLNTLLRNVGKSTEVEIAALDAQAKALERRGVISQQGVKVVQSTLATFDMSAKAIEQMTPAILNYVVAEKGAEASAEDLKAATNGLAQALNGNFASLTRTGFVLDEHTKNMIKNGRRLYRIFHQYRQK